jgi:hypothetical protein
MRQATRLVSVSIAAIDFKTGGVHIETVTAPKADICFFADLG